MRLTRKQQLYVAVLGVGLIAIGLDRTAFSPQPADGASDGSPLVVATTTHSALVAPTPKVVSPALQTRSAVANRPAVVDRERHPGVDRRGARVIPGGLGS